MNALVKMGFVFPWLLAVAVPMHAVAQAPSIPDQLAPTTVKTLPAQADTAAMLEASLLTGAKPDRALELLEGVLVRQPHSDYAYLLKSQALVNIGRLPEALQAALQAVKLDDKRSWNWHAVCSMQLLLNAPLEARPACAKALELEGSYWKAQVSLGHTYLLTGDKAKAYEHYREALGRIKKHADLIAGPLADLDVFIKNEWSVVSAREAKAWFDANWARKRAEDARRALAQNEARYGVLSVETASALQALERALAFLPDAGEQLPERIVLVERVAAIQEQVAGPDSIALATTLTQLGRLREVYPLRDFAGAIKVYDRSLAIRRKRSGAESVDVAEIMLDLGRAHRQLKAFDASIAAFQQALTVYALTNGATHSLTSVARSRLREVLVDSGRAQEGLVVALEELRRAEASGLRDRALSSALLEVARTYERLGEYAAAVPINERLLEVDSALHKGQNWLVASSISELANAYYRAGRWAEALPLFERSVATHESISSLRDLARGYLVLGRFGDSIATGRRTIDLLERSAPSNATSWFSLGWAMEDLASTYRLLLRHSDALSLQEKAAAAYGRGRGSDDSNTIGAVLEMAVTLAAIGRRDDARTHYERSRDAIVAGPLAEEVWILGKLSSAAQAVGAHAEAIRWQERVVSLRTRDLGEGHPRVAAAIGLLAQAKWQAGDRADALRLLEQATAVRERALGPTHPEMVTDYVKLGLLLREMGQHDRALEVSRRALAAAAPSGSPMLVASPSGMLRESHARRGEREAAVFWGKRAVNALQQIRSGLASEPDVQRSYDEQLRGAYTRLADLLVDSGRLSEAEQVLALLKDQELFELVRRSGSTRPQADLVGRERSVAVQYEALVVEAVTRAKELDELTRRARVGVLSEQEEVRREALQTESESWRSRFQGWLNGLSANFASSRDAQAERDRNAQQSTRLQTLVRNDPGAVGLHYVVNDERLSIIISTGRGSFGKSVPVSRATLNRQIAALRQALQEPAHDPRPAAQALYGSLIAPIAPELEAAQARTLVLSLTDTLRYIPFAALHDGNRYLVERYGFGQVILGADQRAEASREAWRVAGLGTTRAIAPYKALPGVRAELEAIVKGEAGRGVVPGTIALDQAFGQRRLESMLDGSFSVVHIGSHFVFRPGDESNSFLLLGDGNRLSLGQLANLDFNGIDLLTLSACDTASGGGENEQGAEVEGLATAVARQGARSVLASLWAVADASTMELMREFYSRRVDQRSSSGAHALREAQLALLRGTTGEATRMQNAPIDALRGTLRAGSANNPAFTPDPSRPFAHPYYWAPFVLMGNWL